MWFVYPETANVRLEDMNVLFGDATSQMPTPASNAETNVLYGQAGSPVPSLHIGQHGAESAIPGLDINPPHVNVENGKPSYPQQAQKREGLGGWISKMVRRTQGQTGTGGARSGARGQYGRLGEADD